MTGLRRRLGLAGLLLALAHPGAAVAARPIDDLVFVTGTDPCVTAAALRPSVRRWLGRDAGDDDLRVDVQTGAALSFVVRVDGRVVANRRFTHLTGACPSVLDAIAIAIALAIDQRGGPAPEATPESRPAPVALAAPATQSAPAAPGRLSVAASGGALLGFPGGAPSYALELGWARARLGVGVGLRGAGPVDVAVGGGTVRSTLVAGEARGCLRAPRTRLTALGCVGAAFGRLLVRPTGFGPEGRAGSATWSAATAEGTLEVPLGGRFGLFVRATLAVPLVRPALDVVDASGRSVARRDFPALGGGGALGVYWLSL